MSVLSGFVLNIMPSGGVKRVAEILCTLTLLWISLEPIMDFDLQAYRVSSANLFELEDEFAKDARNRQERLNYAVIVNEYEQYVIDKAEILGADIQVSLQAQWHDGGVWLPYSINISGQYGEGEKQKISECLRDELGIPKERQYWEYGRIDR